MPNRTCVSVRASKRSSWRRTVGRRARPTASNSIPSAAQTSAPARTPGSGWPEPRRLQIQTASRASAGRIGRM